MASHSLWNLWDQDADVCLQKQSLSMRWLYLQAMAVLNLIINNKLNHFILQLKDDQKAKVDEFFKNCYYVKGPYDEESGYKKLNAELEKLGEGKTVVNRLFYLALPPSVFIDASENIKNNCMGTKYVTW